MKMKSGYVYFKNIRIVFFQVALEIVILLDFEDENNLCFSPTLKKLAKLTLPVFPTPYS
jgi:hypothetical protein